MKTLNAFFLLLALLCSFPGKAAEFYVPDEDPKESECLNKGAMAKFEDDAMSNLERIKRYFETLVVPGQMDTTKVKSSRRRIEKLLKNEEAEEGLAPYKGVFLDGNLNIQKRRTTIVEYINSVIDYRVRYAGLVNTCWTLVGDSIRFTYKAKEKIGYAGGRKLNTGQLAAADQDEAGFYCVYEGEGVIREEVTFFKENQIRRHSVCKKVVFSLRYLVLKAEDGDGYTYQWKTYVSMIVDSVSDDCGKKSDIDDCPVPPGACDSNFVYRRVPILHYLPPGMGFQHFSIRDPKVKLWYFITGAAATSLGVGIYKKIESRRYYDQHLAATTLERLDSDYEKANSRHHEFLIYTGASMLIWGATNTLVFIKDQQNKKLFETRFGCDDRNVFNFQPQEHYLSLCLLPSYSGNPNDLAESLGLGVRYRLQF